mgnify:CR=1 FL=1
MQRIKIFFIICIGLLIAAAVIVGAVFLVDPTVFRDQLEKTASDAFNRPVKFSGPINLAPSLRPRIVIEDIIISNPKWASRPNLAEIDRLDLRVALFPLLRGELTILDVSFSGMDLFLEEGPDGLKNYIFEDEDAGGESGVFPSIEQLGIRDAIIHYQNPDTHVDRVDITEARLWNRPGEPERLDSKGFIKGMPFTVTLAADSPAEQSSPENPWSVDLNVAGPDISLRIDGQMTEPFRLDRIVYRIDVSGTQADAIEALAGVSVPAIGHYELSANVAAAEGKYTVTDIAGYVRGRNGDPDIRILQGEGSRHPDGPIAFALTGSYGGAPFSIRLKTDASPDESALPSTWPLKARLEIRDTRLDLEGSRTSTAGSDAIALQARIEGDTLSTLEPLLGVKIPPSGPYQASCRMQIVGEDCKITDIEGTIRKIFFWETIHISNGKASARKNYPLDVSLDGKLNGIPLSLAVQGGPETTGKSGAINWPFKITASASGAELNAGGTAVPGKEPALQVDIKARGKSLDLLGSLVGTPLPSIPDYRIRASVRNRGHVLDISDLSIESGAGDLSGHVRWDHSNTKPMLSGQIFSTTIAMAELLNRHKASPSGPGVPGPADHPITLGWLADFNADVKLHVENVTGCRIPVQQIASEITLKKGALTAPFRAKLSGTALEGNVQITENKKGPSASLTAKTGRIDAGKTIKALGLSHSISGTADAVQLEVIGSGGTLHDFLKHATVSLQARPADLNLSRSLATRRFDVNLKSVQLTARNDSPVSVTTRGTLQRIAFDSTLTTAPLFDLLMKNQPLPLKLAIQTPELRFNATGTVASPLTGKEFDLTYDMTGKAIEKLNPIVEFVLPLRGPFYLKGQFRNADSLIRLKEELTVGNSDIDAEVTIDPKGKRPHIQIKAFSKQVDLNDIILVAADNADQIKPQTDPARIIPDYTLPMDTLLGADLDIDFKADRVNAKNGHLGDLWITASLNAGKFQSTVEATGFTGAQLSGEYALNVAVDPPPSSARLIVKDLNYGLLFKRLDWTDIVEGRIDIYVDVSGSGKTRRGFLGNSEGDIFLIGGPGTIASRRFDRWASDLATDFAAAMFSPKWQREDVTEMNCVVAHIKLGQGRAQLEKLLLDTRNITIAGSGVLKLDTEALEVFLAPRPKRPSLVSLANPVEIKGTLAKPQFESATLPKKRRLAVTGILAGLINPAFLLLTLSDTGTGEANPCPAAVEEIRAACQPIENMKVSPD